MANKIKLSECLSHETKKHSLIKYIILIFIVVLYFVFMSFRLGTRGGIVATILTWSFFVLSTPIADAGFLLAFPIRLLMGVRMIYTQFFAYIIAILASILALQFNPSVYNSTALLKIFHQILTTPFPLWGIIILSFIGTVLSIYFSDELLDVSRHTKRAKYHKHVNKYYFVIFIFLIGFTVILYNFLLKNLGININ